MKYRLVFKGDIAGDDLDLVKGNMVTLLRIDADAVESLFSGRTVVLKKDVDRELAATFKSAFERTGALCHIEPMEGAALPPDFWAEPAGEPADPLRVPSSSAGQSAAVPSPAGDLPVTETAKNSVVGKMTTAKKAGLCVAVTGLLVVVIVAALKTGVFSLLSSVTKAGHSSLALEDEAALANKGLPRAIDVETREDRVSAGPDNLLIYNFTLVKNSAHSVDMKTLRPVLESRLQQACQDSAIKPLLKRGISISHSYKGKDGSNILTLTLKPGQCM